MANRIVDIHKIRDGRLHIFKRDDSRYWLCRFFVNGRYKVKSTGEEKITAAKRFAEDWYDELRYRIRRGENVHDRKFDACLSG